MTYFLDILFAGIINSWYEGFDHIFTHEGLHIPRLYHEAHQSPEHS